MKVKEAMHAGVYWVAPETSLCDVARLMQEHNVGAIPVGDADRLVGMVTDRDIVCRGLAAGLDLDTACAGDVMSKGIFYTTETAEIAKAAEIMEANRIRRLPVINGSKRMTGMLSVGDISRAGEIELCGEVLEKAAARAA